MPKKRLNILSRFIRNQQNPLSRFVYDLLYNSAELLITIALKISLEHRRDKIHSEIIEQVLTDIAYSNIEGEIARKEAYAALY